MSVATSTRAVEYDGNDATDEFPVPFPFQATSQLVVTSTVTATGVATTLTLGVGYTATITHADNGSPLSGTVTATTPPATGVVLRIERLVSFIQATTLRGRGSFSTATHENALDYLTFLAQQLDERLAAVEGLATLVPSSSYASSRVQAQWTTPSELACPFASPVNVAMPAGNTVVGCKVIRARNITSPSTCFEEPPQAVWQPNGSGLDLLFVSGLDVSTEYLLDLEVLSEAV